MKNLKKFKIDHERVLVVDYITNNSKANFSRVLFLISQFNTAPGSRIIALNRYHEYMKSTHKSVYRRLTSSHHMFTIIRFFFSFSNNLLLITCTAHTSPGNSIWSRCRLHVNSDSAR